MILEGYPFKGKDLEKLKQFLKESDLQYDIGIEYTICITDETNRIIGTGSVEENVIKCVAIDTKHRGLGLSAQIISGLLQYEFEKGRSHILIYTKPKNIEMFSDMGFHCVFQTEDILFMENRKNGFEQYLDELIKETPGKALESKAKVGAVVANCNPFTSGHRYLIEKAKESCDYLHLFILSDDRSFFRTSERMAMVKAGIEGMEGIILHQTSDYIISAATFPTYFFKDRLAGEEANCVLDLNLFGEKISPALNITKRFVGTEPSCQTTNQYNTKMKEILPLKGIDVVEIERACLEEKAISASIVRELIKRKRFGDVRNMVPDKVYQLILTMDLDSKANKRIDNDRRDFRVQ